MYCRTLVGKHCFMNFLMIWFKTEVVSTVELDMMLHADAMLWHY
jgi:hypothetical protein